jgi:hypothetical protein
MLSNTRSIWAPTLNSRLRLRYETLRRDMHALFTDLGITTTPAAA